MPQQRSAGILLYRRAQRGLELLLGHPGGPYWKRKDAGAWMVPKGALEPGEEPLEAAIREFGEEVGPIPAGTPVPLRTVRQNGGKIVEVFALEGNFDPANLDSNDFELEWPPKSGRLKRFPELDAVEWMTVGVARQRILASQAPLIDAIEALLAGAPRDDVESEPSEQKGSKRRPGGGAGLRRDRRAK